MWTFELKRPQKMAILNKNTEIVGLKWDTCQSRDITNLLVGTQTKKPKHKTARNYRTLVCSLLEMQDIWTYQKQFSQRGTKWKAHERHVKSLIHSCLLNKKRLFIASWTSRNVGAWVTLTSVSNCSTKSANIVINMARQGTVCPSGRKPTAAWAKIPTYNTNDLQVDILVSLKASMYTNIDFFPQYETYFY